MKKCPFCSEEIQNDAVKCRYCMEFLNKKIDEVKSTTPNIKTDEVKPTTPNIKNKEVKWTASNYIIIAIFIAIPLFFFFNMDITYKDNVKEKTNTRLTFNEKVSKAHIQYSKRDSGVRSSYLPRVGTMRGEDYRNCIDKEYFFDKATGVQQDSIDFCRWHAGLGSYSK